MYADRPRREASGGVKTGAISSRRQSTKPGIVMTFNVTQKDTGIQFAWSLVSGHARRRHSGEAYQTAHPDQREEVLAPISW